MESGPTSSEDPFWWEEPSILFHPARLLEFYPGPSLPRNAKLNAIARLGLYGSFVLLVYRPDPRMLYVAALALAGTWFVWSYGSPRDEGYDTMRPKAAASLGELQDPLKDKGAFLGHLTAFEDPSLAHQPFAPRSAYVQSFGGDAMPQPTVMRDGAECVGPTRNNPYMNVQPSDYMDDPRRPAACVLTDEDVTRTAEQHAKYNLYQDVSDLFGNMTSTRSFYTMPSTTIPNDQGSFASWLYGDVNKGCKSGHLERCLPSSDLRIQQGRIEDQMSSYNRTAPAPSVRPINQ
jgi:hypothetical protein